MIMKKLLNIIGTKHGRLTVLSEAERSYTRRFLCFCECGKEVIVNLQSLRYGVTKSCGCLRSELQRQRHLGSNNPQWKGELVGNKGLHKWVIRHLPKPDFCADCKKSKPRDLANISQEYKRDLTDWEWLCRRCHMVKDGRLKKLADGSAEAQKRMILSRKNNAK